MAAFMIGAFSMIVDHKMVIKRNAGSYPYLAIKDVVISSVIISISCTEAAQLDSKNSISTF